MRVIFTGLLALSLAVMCQHRLEADVIVSTLTGYDSVLGAAIGPSGLAEAAEFTVASGSFNLSSIILPLGDLTGGSTATVELVADNGGLPTGTVLDTMSAPVANLSLPVTATTTFTSVLDPLLTAGHSYWIVVETGSLSALSWQNAAVPNGTSATSPDGITWSPDPGESAPLGGLAFEVDGTPQGSVPEPGTLAMFGIGLVGLIGWRRKAK